MNSRCSRPRSSALGGTAIGIGAQRRLCVRLVTAGGELSALLTSRLHMSPAYLVPRDHDSTAPRTASAKTDDAGAELSSSVRVGVLPWALP